MTGNAGLPQGNCPVAARHHLKGHHGVESFARGSWGVDRGRLPARHCCWVPSRPVICVDVIPDQIFSAFRIMVLWEAPERSGVALAPACSDITVKRSLTFGYPVFRGNLFQRANRACWPALAPVADPLDVKPGRLRRHERLLGHDPIKMSFRDQSAGSSPRAKMPNSRRQR